MQYSMDPDTTILAVDDAPENLTLLTELLQPHYRVRVATSGEKALELTRSNLRPDLILLDIMMPGLDGYQVFEQLRAEPQTRHIPIIFLTALDNIDSQRKGLELGAVDYLPKPFVAPILLARIRNQLELKKARDLLQDHNAWLEAEVERRLHENNITQLVSIRALAHLAEIRDPETGNHILRTQCYVQLLANLLQDHPHYQPQLSERYIDLLTRSAPLHDIGKVGIPDAILQKPGRLTAEEWAIMKTHAELGARAIEMAERDADKPVEFLALAKEIAHWHHERWDGSGYPDGLRGEKIPLSARLMAIADVFDALISKRVYKEAFSYQQSRQIIAEGCGHHFDPDIAETFLSHFDLFCAIADQHQEPLP